MKRIILFSLVLLCITGHSVVAQKPRLRRVVGNPVVVKKAAPKAVDTFVAFFEYVKKDAPDIAKDAKAQERWLTKQLREQMAKHNKAWDEYMKKNPTDKPGHADNSSFLGVWNQPTTYSIVSARQYDYRNSNNPKALRTVIDVFYEWSNETDENNQYPGVRNLHSFMFVLENNSWKLEDIYIYNDEFTSAQSLYQSFNDRPN